jgi:hypothetical protein
MSDDDLTIHELRMRLDEAYTLLRACIPYVEQFYQRSTFAEGAHNVLNKINETLKIPHKE